MEPNATTQTETEYLTELKTFGPQWVELYEEYRADGMSHVDASARIDFWLDSILAPADIVVMV